MGRNARSNWSENQVSRRWAKVASIKGVLNQFFGPDYQAGAPGSEYLADARTAAMITGCEAAALRTSLDQLTRLTLQSLPRSRRTSG